MAWKAIIESVTDPAVANDTVDISVRYVSDDGSDFVRGYNLTAGNFKTVDEVAELLASNLRNLEEFDGVKAAVAPLVGKEITVDAKGLPVVKA